MLTLKKEWRPHKPLTEPLESVLSADASLFPDPLGLRVCLSLHDSQPHLLTAAGTVYLSGTGSQAVLNYLMSSRSPKCD